VSRRLVEECARFSLAVARRHLGHLALLEAYRRGHAIIWPGVPVPIDLAADVVHLPWSIYRGRAISTTRAPIPSGSGCSARAAAAGAWSYMACPQPSAPTPRLSTLPGAGVLLATL
jgi:hypothetical protein